MTRAAARRSFAAMAMLLCLAWFAGFVWFAAEAARSPPVPPVADGIVALTGGADRIAAAIALLRDGRARRLLISGVGPGADLKALVHGTGIDAATLRDRITLGRVATDTEGNARETAEWVRRNGIRSLIVVTAGYHMKRALTEMTRELPEVTLYPAPVRRRFSLRLMADEYTKWIAAAVGVTRWQKS